MKLKLFISTFEKNEYRSILGKRKSNFWILFGIFLFAIAALAFSRSGLTYLSHKMNDPFINWILIREQGDNFKRFRIDVADTAVLKKYEIGASEANTYINAYLYSTEKKKYYVEGRTIAHDSRLLERILDDNNTIVKRDKATKSTDFGWIVTQELMERLGYTDADDYPLFMDYSFNGDSNNVPNWHIPVFKNYDMVIPIPIIAVVKQLPDLLDFIAPRFFLERYETNVFNLSAHKEYFYDLVWVTTDTQGVATQMKAILNQEGLNYNHQFEVSEYTDALLHAYQMRVILYDTLVPAINDAAMKIVTAIPNVYRFYQYDTREGWNFETPYLSFMFDNLARVSDFAEWVKNEYGIRIDMAQIEAKNNFNTFNLLAAVLCMAIVLLSALFVTIFLWFLIDSHFKSISRNLGTIMAFGLPNKTIVHSYQVVFLRLILFALSLAVIVLAGVELLLFELGMVREGNYNYIELLDAWVWVFIIIIPILTLIVVSITIKQKLKSNPGDLIFERNI